MLTFQLVCDKRQLPMIRYILTSIWKSKNIFNKLNTNLGIPMINLITCYNIGEYNFKEQQLKIKTKKPYNTINFFFFYLEIPISYAEDNLVATIHNCRKANAQRSTTQNYKINVKRRWIVWTEHYFSLFLFPTWICCEFFFFHS